MSLQEYFNYNINFNTSNSLTLGQTTVGSIFTPGSGMLTHTVNTIGNMFMTGGNIGIGTTSPAEQLHITGNLLLRPNTLGPGGTNYIQFADPDAGTGPMQIRYQDSGTPALGIMGGRLGVGTTSPSTTLDVNGSTRIVSGLTSAFNSNTLGSLITTSGNVGIGTVAPSYTLDVSGSGRFSNNLLATFNSNTLGNIFTTGGNVGIGTTSPSRKLHVTSDMRIGGSGAVLDFGDDFTTQIYRNGTTSEIRFNTSSIERVTITSTGNVGIGTNSPAYTLDINGTFEANNVNGTLLFASSGNVGIGTSTPTYKLDVNGSLRSTGDIFVGNGTGAESLNLWDIPGAAWQLATGDHKLNIRNGTVGSTMVDRVTIASSGNVGIGITPGAPLDIKGASSWGIVRLSPASIGGESSIAFFPNNFDPQTGATNANWAIGTNLFGGGTNNFNIYRNGIATAFTINSSGHVGIGTNSPTNLLHVNGIAALSTLVGNVTSQTANDTLYLGTTGNTNFFIDRPTGNSGGAIIFGFNTAKTTERSLLTIYNNSTDRNIIFNAQSKGASGTDLIQIPVGLQATFNNNTLGSIITTGGNVGIGTASPSARLHAFSNDTLNTLFVENNGGGGGTQASLRVKMNAASSNRNILQLENGTNTVMIVRDDGNVGIGTTSPGYKFDVISGDFPMRILGSTLDSTVIRFQNTSAGGRTYHVGSTGTGSGAGVGFSIYDVTGSAPRVLIGSNGNVGIGTNSPTSALQVNGAITHGGGYAVFGLSVATYAAGSSQMSFGNTQFSSRITNSGNYFTFQDAGIFMIHVKINSDTIVTSGIQLFCSYYNGTSWVTYQSSEDNRAYNNQGEFVTHFMVSASANQSWAIFLNNQSGANWAFSTDAVSGSIWSRLMIYKVA